MIPLRQLRTLVFSVGLITSLHLIPVQPLPVRTSQFRDCGCLPSHFEGRLRIANMNSINHDDVDWMLLIRLLQEEYSKQEVTGDLQLLFRIDLVSGLFVFESDGNDNKLGRWAIVVDVSDLSNHGDRSRTSQDQRLTAAMIYKIDLDSGRVWNIGSGRFRGAESGRGSQNLQYTVNRCPMSGGQHGVIDELSWLHILNHKNSLLPLLLSTSSESCLPRVLSDIAHIAVMFDIEEQLERLSPEVEALELRSYILQHNEGFRDDVSINPVTAAIDLVLRLILIETIEEKEQEEQEESFSGCCTPMQWQASMTKTLSYQFGNKITGTQTTVMDRVFVDHTLNAIAGDFYNVVNNQPINNSTFLALYDPETSESFVIYVVDITSNSCIAANITGITRTQSSHCLTKETMNLTSETTVGLKTTMYGWTKTINAMDGSYNGSTNIYVTLVDDDVIAHRRHKVTNGMSSLPLCVVVSEMTQMSSILESFSDTVVVYNTTIQIPNDVFQMPPSCVGVTAITYSEATMSAAVQNALAMASLL